MLLTVQIYQNDTLLTELKGAPVAIKKESNLVNIYKTACLPDNLERFSKDLEILRYILVYKSLYINYLSMLHKILVFLLVFVSF